MTDRELLELAAKAAGIEYDVEASKPHPVSKAFWGLWLVIHGEPSEYQRRNWNPITDDGDALRLAVKLGLFNDEDFVAELKAIWMYSCTDYYAATRRAIVCVVAEIGKAMP